MREAVSSLTVLIPVLCKVIVNSLIGVEGVYC